MNDPWPEAIHHIEKGNFTALQELLGGPDAFDKKLVEWHQLGKFNNHAEMLAEALTCACMLGRTTTAEYLIDAGVDPTAGTKTGQTGAHYAASSGHRDTVEMLIRRSVPLETGNMFGGTVLGQALWSAVNEHKDTHSDIIEALVEAGAAIEPGTTEWWSSQPVPSETTKRRVLEVLSRKKAK